MINFRGIDNFGETPNYFVVADLHLHDKPAWHLKVCEELIDALGKYSRRAPGKITLLLLGDVVEVRDKVPAAVIELVNKLVSSWNGPIIWMTGQHDSVTPGVPTFKGLDDVKKNVTFVTSEPLYMGKQVGVALLPYFRDLEVYKQQLQVVRQMGAKYLFTHMPLAEVLEKFGAKEPNAIRLSEFHGFAQVISGDIHQACQTGNFMYVGAPKQRSWQDYGLQPQVMLVWEESGKGKLKFESFEVEGIVYHMKLESSDEINSFIQRPTKAVLRVENLPYTRAGEERLNAVESVQGLSWAAESVVREAVGEGRERLASLDPREAIRGYVEGASSKEFNDDELVEAGEAFYYDLYG